MQKSIYYILISGLFFLTVELSADILFLRDGRSMEGTIVGQSRTSVRLNSNGNIKEYKKADIKRIEYTKVKTDEDKQKEELEKENKIKEELQTKKDLDRKKNEEAVLLRKQEEEKQIRIKKQEDEKKELERRKKEEAVLKNKETRSDYKLSSVLWRSAVLPGWGQLYADQKKTGIGFASAFGASLFYAGSLYTAQSSAKKSYFDAGTNLTLLNISGAVSDPALFPYSYIEDSKNLSSYKAKVHNTNSVIATAGTIYIGSLIHAVYTGFRQKKQMGNTSYYYHYILDISPAAVSYNGSSKIENAGRIGLKIQF